MTREPVGSEPGLPRSIILCTTSYAIAGGVALALVYTLGDRSPVLIAGLADLAATLVIFGFSTFYRNSSLYDPYWSVAPVPIAVYWALNPAAAGVSRIRQVLAISLVSLWAVRLTYNWFRRWEGLAHEDWRYSDLRRKTGKWYWLVDLTGIHLFPTIQVFLGCVALYPVLSMGGLPGIVWVKSLAEIAPGRIEVEATAVEIDGVAEALPVAEAT